MIRAFCIFQSYDSWLYGKNTARPEGNQVQENEKGKEVKNYFSRATPQFPEHALVHQYIRLNSNALKRHNLLSSILFCSSWTAVSKGIMMWRGEEAKARGRAVLGWTKLVFKSFRRFRQPKLSGHSNHQFHRVGEKYFCSKTSNVAAQHTQKQG